ncbi:Crp/Fnr family transcriptional regulator [Capnocytophaga canimorsus]|uniref:cAMP regulatory protein n=1 Tax=Capnocytophaga canimorsus (strain 5) TaxID=860228 RepID=F9YRB7_CAPCC|nr:Crp/Fnr family transcriptional regulator [Capnocytophaga canimorsus]AEK22475.1 cAMP regulatory protein [Capnocytophaga canimorsus Cc5]CEN48807.1 cAMP regulatory protein [Capnocytophaga canimorsus]VEJ19858.1 cAMP regulatory protein [Capnocytophaga canimorsus]
MLSSDIFKNPIFKVLSSRERAVFQANTTYLKFEEEEMFIKEGSMLFSVYFIVQGMVKVCDPKKRLFWISDTNDFLGLISLYTEEPIFFSAYATKDTHIIQIDLHVFKKFIATNPLFLNAVFAQNATDFRKIIQSNITYKETKISGAMAHFLLEYSQKGFLKHLTRKEMGEMLGYSRENITKIIQTFIREGYIIEKNKQIIITNQTALEQLKKYG